MNITELNENALVLTEWDDILRLERQFSLMTEAECMSYFSNDLLEEGVQEWLATKKSNVTEWYNKQSETVKYVVGLNGKPKTLNNFAVQINKWNGIELNSIQKELGIFVDKMNEVVSSSTVVQKVKSVITIIITKAQSIIGFIRTKYKEITALSGWKKLIMSVGFSALISKLRSIKTKIIDFVSGFSIDNIGASLQNINFIGKIFDEFEGLKSRLLNVIAKAAGDLGGVTVFFNILKTMKDALSFVMALLQKAKSKFDSVPLIA